MTNMRGAGVSSRWVFFLVQYFLLSCEISCQTKRGVFELHAYGAVYIDNRLVGRGSLFMDSTNVTFEVSGQPSILSVEAVGNQTLIFVAGPPPFIIGFYGNSVTGQQWKCSSKLESRWTSLDFDDSAWTPAFIRNETTFTDLRSNEASIAKMPPNARFIWSNQSNVLNGGYVAFCRLKLPDNGLRHQMFMKTVPSDVGGRIIDRIQATSVVECSVGCSMFGRCLCTRHVQGSSWSKWTCAGESPHEACCSFYWLQSGGECIFFDALRPDFIRNIDWNFYAPSLTIEG